MSWFKSVALIGVGLIGIVGSVEAAGAARSNRPQRKSAADVTSLNDVSMEVDALLTLHHFQMSREQLATLRRWAADTMQKPTKRQPPRATPEYRRALLELYVALRDHAEDARIDELTEKLDDVAEDSDPDIDDDVELTPASRKRAPEAFALLNKQQVARFFEHQEEPKDAKEMLRSAIDHAGKASDAEWKELSEEIISDLGNQRGGVEIDRARTAAGQLTSWLRMVRSLSDRERQQKRPELEKALMDLVDTVSPEQMRENLAMRALAELLANPRLVAAIDARSKR
jgi:hypothetical protein